MTGDCVPLDSAAAFGRNRVSGNGRKWEEVGLQALCEFQPVSGGVITRAL